MRSEEQLDYRFPDAASARRAAAALALVAGSISPAEAKAALGRRPRAMGKLESLIADVGAGAARIESIATSGDALSFTFALHDDIDVWREESGRGPTKDQLERALLRLLEELGGLTAQEHASRERRRAREAVAESTRELSGQDLLAALTPLDSDLRRYERVFVASLRTSVAAGTLLDGQRVEAARILDRLGKR